MCQPVVFCFIKLPQDLATFQDCFADGFTFDYFVKFSAFVISQSDGIYFRSCHKAHRFFSIITYGDIYWKNYLSKYKRVSTLVAWNTNNILLYTEMVILAVPTYNKYIIIPIIYMYHSVFHFHYDNSYLHETLLPQWFCHVSHNYILHGTMSGC